MIVTIPEVCHCGHDRDTHYEKKHACCGMHCECIEYGDRHKPDTRARAVKKDAPTEPSLDDDWSHW